MAMMMTKLAVADNTGAHIVQMITLAARKAKYQHAFTGDVIIGSVKKLRPRIETRLQKGQIVRAVLVRTKTPVTQADGTKTSFGDNAVVLVDAKQNPLGTRIFGPVAKELQSRPNLAKILALSKASF